MKQCGLSRDTEKKNMVVQHIVRTYTGAQFTLIFNI